MQNNVSMGNVMPHTQSNENKTQQKQLAMLRLATAVWGQVLKNWGDWQDNGEELRRRADRKIEKRLRWIQS